MLSKQDLGNLLALIDNANIKGKDAITIASIQQKLLMMLKSLDPKDNGKKPTPEKVEVKK